MRICIVVIFTAQCWRRQTTTGGEGWFPCRRLPMGYVQLVTPYTRMNPGISNSIFPHGPFPILVEELCILLRIEDDRMNFVQQCSRRKIFVHRCLYTLCKHDRNNPARIYFYEYRSTSTTYSVLCTVHPYIHCKYKYTRTWYNCTVPGIVHVHSHSTLVNVLVLAEWIGYTNIYYTNLTGSLVITYHATTSAGRPNPSCTPSSMISWILKVSRRNAGWCLWRTSTDTTLRTADIHNSTRTISQC